MKLKLEFLNEIAEKYDISLTHFLVKTIQCNDSTEGVGRFADQYIPADTDVAIIGGLIVNELDCTAYRPTIISSSSSYAA